MVFKSFVWPHNPKNINITMINDSKIYNLPGLGSFRKQNSKSYRIISGDGELFGKNAINQFEQLCNLFSQPSSGKLELTSIKSITAYFTELSMTSNPSPNIISYKFKFIEDIKTQVLPINPSTTDSQIGILANKTFNSNKREHTLDIGENLWDISCRFKVSIDSLLNANPNISDPYNVHDGLKVYIEEVHN